MPHESQLGLWAEAALRAFEWRLAGQILGNLAEKVLSAVMIVQISRIQESLSANLAIIGFQSQVPEVPRVSKLVLHSNKYSLVIQAIMPHQVKMVSSQKGAFRAFVRTT